jgi:hypothetical protein
VKWVKDAAYAVVRVLRTFYSPTVSTPMQLVTPPRNEAVRAKRSNNRPWRVLLVARSDVVESATIPIDTLKM